MTTIRRLVVGLIHSLALWNFATGFSPSMPVGWMASRHNVARRLRQRAPALKDDDDSDKDKDGVFATQGGAQLAGILDMIKDAIMKRPKQTEDPLDYALKNG